jgi:AcrR family transcriptional regulator
MGRPATDARERILEALIQIAAGGDPARLTLAEVAAATGLSKAGILYYFPDKEALLIGLLEHLGQRYEAELERLRAREPADAAGAYCRALIDLQCAPEDDRAFAALAAVLHQFPRLREVYGQRTQFFHERIFNDGVPPGDAALILCASDGLWFADILGFPPLPSGAREALIETLRKLTRREL